MSGDETAEAKDLKPKLHQWLKKNGYPLEMRVARAMTRAGFSVTQSDYFQDTNELGAKVWRECDVTAQKGYIYHRVDPVVAGARVNLLHDLLLVCECKNNAQGTRPWIVFTDRLHFDMRAPRDAYLPHPMTSLANQYLRTLAIEYKLQRPALYAPGPHGYAASCAIIGNNEQSRNHNEDGAYKAITKVLSGARAAIENLPTVYHVFRIAIPVVVVTAPLYECYLDENTETQLEERDEMTILWRNPAVGVPEAAVHVIREKALPTFIEKVTALSNETHRHEPELLKTYAESKRRQLFHQEQHQKQRERELRRAGRKALTNRQRSLKKER
jgi:hypothetical protein